MRYGDSGPFSAGRSDTISRVQAAALSQVVHYSNAGEHHPAQHPHKGEDVKGASVESVGFVFAPGRTRYSSE